MNHFEHLRSANRSAVRIVSAAAMGWTMLVTVPLATAAQEGRSARAPEMEALASYMGTWEAAERTAQDGRSFHFVYRLGWFDRSETIVEMAITQRFADGEDRLLWKGFKGWDSVQQSTYYHGFSPSGRAALGSLEMEGEQLVTAYRGWSPDGAPVEIRDIFSPVEDGRFAARTLVRTGPGDEWREVSSDHWRRVEAGP